MQGSRMRWGFAQIRRFAECGDFPPWRMHDATFRTRFRGHARRRRHRRGGRATPPWARGRRCGRVVCARLARDVPLRCPCSCPSRAASPAAPPVARSRTPPACPWPAPGSARDPSAPPPASPPRPRRPPPPPRASRIPPRGITDSTTAILPTATCATPPVTVERLRGRASSPAGTGTGPAPGTSIRSTARAPTTGTERCPERSAICRPSRPRDVPDHHRFEETSDIVAHVRCAPPAESVTFATRFQKGRHAARPDSSLHHVRPQLE